MSNSSVAAQPQTGDEWLTIAEVAKRMKVRHTQAQRWVYRGIVPSHVLPGGRGRRVRASDLDAAMGEPAAPKFYIS